MSTGISEIGSHPKDVVLQPLLILWMRADFTYSGRHGALSLTSLYCLLLAGLKGTGLMPVAVASLLLMQLHHRNGVGALNN